ncbi:MAG: SANT/Myb-like DNA-binding domain-containing protein [bacterium]|nr:SANT/Myb-like DNA-binding domain-containing protein [bacterium]
MTKRIADSARKASPPYSLDEDARLKRICSDECPAGEAGWTKISTQFPGRTALALRQRFLMLRKREAGTPPRRRVRDSVGTNDAQRRVTMQEPIAEAKLPRHTTLTAAVFGDPLPGRSALDRMLADA